MSTMDPIELARWTRFAAKGGIGKCTAINDCVAESSEDLMFLTVRPPPPVPSSPPNPSSRTTKSRCFSKYPTKRASTSYVSSFYPPGVY